MTDKEMVIHLAQTVGYQVHEDKTDQWHFPFYKQIFVGPTIIQMGLHDGQINYKFDAGKLIEISNSV